MGVTKQPDSGKRRLLGVPSRWHWRTPRCIGVRVVPQSPPERIWQVRRLHSLRRTWLPRMCEIRFTTAVPAQVKDR
ncbi:hypothetical protein MTO96_023756 [Rhipicephalus appendiculatus]